MTADELRQRLASLYQQRAEAATNANRYLAAKTQIEGAIGFCKGLIEEAERNPESNGSGPVLPNRVNWGESIQPLTPEELEK